MNRTTTRLENRAPQQRALRAGALVLPCLLLVGALGCDAVVGRMVDAAVQRQMNAGHPEWLEDDAMHVVYDIGTQHLATLGAAVDCWRERTRQPLGWTVQNAHSWTWNGL